MAVVDRLLLASKFRGCLVGALLGDCLGSPYEGEEEVRKIELQKYLDKLDGPYFKIPYKPYTDDTAMTRSVAESLIEYKGFDALDMAKRFVKEFVQEPRRGYGANIATVFHKLRGSNFKDVYAPAREQFDGLGSYGNGAAMRIAPVALYCHNNLDNLMHITKKSSEITHSNRLGVNGAVLQCLAIHKCLFLNPKETLNTKNFTTELLTQMAKVEKDSDDHLDSHGSDYQVQIKLLLKLLERESHPSDETVVDTLGHSVSALYSVPTAVYCFLKAQNPIPHIGTDNPFRRTIQYAISLGGDTDTIASMAGAIAGAFYGYDIINNSLQKHSEDCDYMITLANNLFELSCT